MSFAVLRLITSSNLGPRLRISEARFPEEAAHHGREESAPVQPETLRPAAGREVEATGASGQPQRPYTSATSPERVLHGGCDAGQNPRRKARRRGTMGAAFQRDPPAGRGEASARPDDPPTQQGAGRGGSVHARS